MSTRARYTLFALLGLTSFFQHGAATTLGPILNPACNWTSPANLIPSQNVTLGYGLSGSSMVNVSLAMSQPTVLLEEVGTISSVDCEESSVTVVFNTTRAFNMAVSMWPQNTDFILITNHLGNCDAELERGFFLGNGVRAINETLTLIVSAEKTDVNSTAESTEISFSSVPVATVKRDVTLNPSLLNISNTLDLPAATTLYSYDPFVTITADSADLSTAVTLSGYLKYSVLLFKLEELFFDFDVSVAASLGLTVDIKAPYNTTATYTAPSLAYNVVDIPGIVTLGPALDFAIGVAFAANAGVSVTGDFKASIDNGNVHVDFKDSSASSATGWTPKFSATANITEKAEVSVNPFIDVTVELECKLLGDLLDLSLGLTAEPKFNNNFTFSASQDLSSAGTITQPNTTTCEQGVEIDSDFELSVIGFATQFWKDTLFSVTVPIAKQCYTWL